MLSTTSGRYQNIRLNILQWRGSTGPAALQHCSRWRQHQVLCIIYQAPNLANTSILHTAGLNLTTLYYQVCVLYLLCYTPPQSKYMYLYRGVEIISTSVVHIWYENIKISTGWVKKKCDLKKHGHNCSEIHQKGKKLVCSGKFSLNAAG